ncbi:hypothetical protein [Lysobacter enzymogenes]|uniref:hypothetical protein n=1 Tax=Lysobacter enzymogenes TaxID=69 RepID=UPI002263D03F|nr:hypothetical protein [Lysobacter enzymogenes]UZW62764.1 hypothetical protein BV903_010920 [Lysobacter enzymogenes]
MLATVFKVVAAAGIIVKNIVEGLVNTLVFLGSASVNVGAFITKGLVGSFRLLGDAVTGLMAGKNPLDVFKDYVSGAARLATQTRANLDELKNSIVAGYGAAKDGVLDSGRDIANGMTKLFNDVEAGAGGAEKAAGKAATVNQGLLNRVKSLLAGDGSKKNDAKDKLDAIAAAAMLAQDEVKRAIAALDQQFSDIKDADKTAADITAYYDKRVDLQQKLIDLQIDQAQAELAATKELGKRQQIEARLTILQRDRLQAAALGAHDEKRALEEFNKLRLERLNTRSSNITGTLSASESAISAQMSAGMLGQAEGERRLRQIRQQSLDQLAKLRDAQQAYIASLSPSDPNMQAAQQGLLGIDTSIANVTASMNVMGQSISDGALSSLNTFWSNLKDGTQSALASVRQLISDFASDIYATLTQNLSKSLVGSLQGTFNQAGGWLSNLLGGGGESAAAATSAATVQAGATTAAAALTTAGTATAASLGTGATTAAAALTAAGTSTAAAIGAGATTAASGIMTAGATLSATMISGATTAAAILRAANTVSSIGAAHSGGRAGSLRLIRNNINPLVFGTAPRYHGGGVAGLQNNEIPAILKRGEVVRTQQQEAALQARLGSGQGGGAQPCGTSSCSARTNWPAPWRAPRARRS